MKDRFLQYITSLTTLSKEEEEMLLAGLVIKEFKKGTTVVHEGKLTHDTFLILDGCIRKHRLIDGVEKTTGFYVEYDVVAEFESLALGKPAVHSYTCVEDTSVVVTNAQEEKEFYKLFPRFEEVSRLEMEKMLGRNQEELSNFIIKSPEERYIHLAEYKPDLLQRVPQHQIASYIGVTPESLSRIRKRIMK